MNNQLQREISVITVLKYAFPSIIMMVIMSLYTIVDGTFVSRLIGTDAFSAVNIVYPLLSLTLGLGTMFGTGLTAIVSIKLGEKKQKEANQNFTFIIMFSVVLGIVLSGFFLLFLNDIIRLLGANHDIFQYCYDYAFPLLFFIPANILQPQFQNLYIANGKPHIGLILTTIGGLANILLDYLFIAVFDMGIAGAALATGIGYVIPALYGLFYFSVTQKGLLHFVKPVIDKKVLLHTMANGSSEMINYLSTSITTFLFNIIMMRLIGQDGVAAIAILLYLDFILVAIVMGYSIGVAPLFSYNLGAGNHEKIRRLYQISTKFCLILGIAMTSITVIFSRPLTQIFTSPDSKVFALAASGLTIYAFGYLIKGFNIFASSMFTAFGNGKVSAALSFMRTLLFLVLSLIILSWLFQVNGVWFATPIAELLAFLTAVFFVVKYKKTYYYGNL